jgi:membrane-associated phospholipid phosphatase
MSDEPVRKRPAWYLEIVLLVGGYLVFGLVRAAIDRGDPAATDNAALVHGLERTLGIAIELPLNSAMLDHPFAMQLTGYFYRLCVIAVPIVLIWLYVRRPDRYRFLRTALVVMTLADLLFVWLYPEAPPRLSLDGVVDYMAVYDILGGASLRNPGPALNIHGAMPSMHIAWTTWSAYAVWSVLRSRRPLVAWSAWLLPVVTAFVILVTGHHYVLDIVAGVALVAVVVPAVTWSTRVADMSRS